MKVGWNDLVGRPNLASRPTDADGEGLSNIVNKLTMLPPTIDHPPRVWVP